MSNNTDLEKLIDAAKEDLANKYEEILNNEQQAD